MQLTSLSSIMWLSRSAPSFLRSFYACLEGLSFGNAHTRSPNSISLLRDSISLPTSTSSSYLSQHCGRFKWRQKGRSVYSWFSWQAPCMQNPETWHWNRWFWNRACISSILGIVYRVRQDRSSDVSWNFAPEIILV